MSKVSRMLTLAGDLSRARQDGRRFFHGALAFRGDGTLVHAVNGTPKFPDAYHHCERRLARKLDKRATVFLARVLADGTWGNSKPCFSCEVSLKAAKVRRIFYTVGHGEYGCQWF